MKNIYIKRIVSVTLLVALTATLPTFDGSNFWSALSGQTEVYAASSSIKQKAEAEKKKAEEEKKKAQEEKKQAEADKKKAEQKAEDAEYEVNKLENKVENTQEDIDYTVNKVNKVVAEQNEINDKIDVKQDEIEQCEIDLGLAKDAVDEEYESMKLRIQFMYENSATGSVWMAILGSSGIADLLNRIEYVSDVYGADRDLMANYEAKVAKVEELSAKLESDMDELLVLQEENEKKKEELDEELAYLNRLKDKLKTQLADAKSDAAAAQRAIENAEKAASDAQKAADSAQKNIDKQAEIIRRQEALAAGANSDNYEGGGTGSAGVSSNVSYLNDLANNPEPNPNVSGEEIVAFAKQFVGRPYKWGGNSLTNGVDCSGFVHLVYAHFGISTPRYSQAFKSWGKPVAVANVQPGDVVVYPGHVAIYAGNGVIVEAQSTKAGITCNRKFICHKVTGLRRYAK